jgi:hypothetical protein
LGRSVLPDHSTREPFAHLQRALKMVDGRAPTGRAQNLCEYLGLLVTR